VTVSGGGGVFGGGEVAHIAIKMLKKKTPLLPNSPGGKFREGQYDACGAEETVLS